MGRHYSSSRRDDSEATDQTNREKYFHKSGNTSHPRRHTESDASYNHWQTDYPDPEVGGLYRASTIDRWDDRHRQRAARQPMVEYMCEEPVKEQDENERPIIIPCQKRCCQPELDDDEEAPLTIPSTYQYDPSAHISASSSRIAPSHTQFLSSYNIDPHHQYHHHHQQQHHSHNPCFENEASNRGPYGDNHDDDDNNENENGEDETPGFGKDELISKVSAYVLSRSGAHGPLTPESNRLVHSLANEILTALRTGSWDQVPRELVREVQQVLT